MESIVLFGAGEICRKNLLRIIYDYDIMAVIDSSAEKQKNHILGIPVISLEEYMSSMANVKIVITMNERNAAEAEKILAEHGISGAIKYTELKFSGYAPEKRIISYALDQLEDVILYNVFSDFDEIFYIDAGSCDPSYGSVTKYLYDTLNAHGINIEPQEEFFPYYETERKRDINICAGLGNCEEVSDFHVQGRLGAMSTFVPANIDKSSYKEVRRVRITTLKAICEQYVPKDCGIAFLKIDVEGAERSVLEGADLVNYRPMVILLESTLPNSMIFCHGDWEDILLDSGYHYVYTYGVNRYYVADEFSYLDERFVSMAEILRKYKIQYADLKDLTP